MAINSASRYRNIYAHIIAGIKLHMPENQNAAEMHRSASIAQIRNDVFSEEQIHIIVRAVVRLLSDKNK